MHILHIIDFHADKKDEIRKYLEEKGIEFSHKGMHFGNLCLVNIPDGLFRQMHEDLKFGATSKIQYRKCKHIIERKDFKKYRIGNQLHD